MPKPNNRRKPVNNGNKQDKFVKEDKLEKKENTQRGSSKYKQDPFWYAMDAQAIADMANIPFLTVIGEPITSKDAVPGLIGIHVNHAIGNDAPVSSTELYGDYVNKSANMFFQYLTQGFTSSVPFQASDLMMAELAAASLSALLVEGKRIYGLMNYYLQNNAYYAKHIVEGLGYDYNDIKANLADFRSEYNLRAETFNKTVALVTDFTIKDRWQFISSYVFTDTSQPEYSTAFAYIIDNALLYDATAATTGTCLRWFNIHQSSYLLKVRDYFSRIDTMMEALNSEDVRQMFGALRRVYSDGQFDKCGSLDKDFMTTIVKHDVVSMQLHNACWDSVNRVAGVLPESYWGDDSGNAIYEQIPVYQDSNGNIRSDVVRVSNTEYSANSYVRYSPVIGDKGIILDMYDHLVNPGNILDATVHMEVPMYAPFEYYPPVDDSSYAAWKIFFRSEVITKVESITINNMNTTTRNIVSKYAKATQVGANIYGYELTPGQFHITKLDSAPLLLTYSSLGTHHTPAITNVLGEMDRYTYVSDEVIKKLHAKTFFKLLLLPSASKSVSK